MGLKKRAYINGNYFERKSDITSLIILNIAFISNELPLHFVKFKTIMSNNLVTVLLVIYGR